MSELWDRMTEAMVNETIENPFYQEADLLRAALTVAAESDEDAFIERLGLVAIGDIADVLLSLAATGGDSDE